MRYNPEQKLATKNKMLKAAHSGFRRQGYEGAGVDGLAKEAGVTSGAFYKHFGSKAVAFRESVQLGVGEFQAAVEMYQKEFGDSWLKEFAAFYLGEKRCSELGNSCALQSLTPEVTRSDADTRLAFQSALLKAVQAFASGLPADRGRSQTNEAWSNIALLIGGVTLARAVQESGLADEIAEAVLGAISRMPDGKA
ncbi:MAG: TetR/AcrR family transcriptional regulator [Candidatus Thiodiazotropha sp. (ex Ctena orbiculata)]|nr:TetR/AcrR family transcriptional regulator [Candidatus Thiodiazotropha taylori]